MTTIALVAGGLILLSVGILIGVVLGVVAAASSVQPQPRSSDWTCPRPGCGYPEAHYHVHDADGEHVVFVHEVHE